MPREPKTAIRLRKLTAWLAAEHGIRADAEHLQDAAGRWQWWLRWYDGPAELPHIGAKAAELGVDTSRLMSARVITGRALAVIAARIALREDLPVYRDPARLAQAIMAEARSTDHPERAADSAEDSLAALLSERAGNSAEDSLAALVIEHSATSGGTADASPDTVRVPAAPAKTSAADQAAVARAEGEGTADPLTRTMEILAGLIGAARDGSLDTAAALGSLTAARRLADELERGELALIEAARDSGATWAQIAVALGASNRQTAQKRHADLTRRIHRPPTVDIPQPETGGQPGQGAVRAAAIAHDPRIEDTATPGAGTPAPARTRAAGTGGKRRPDPRITPEIIREGRYEIVRAPGHAESRAWHVLVSGNRAGLVRPTWRGERGRPGWEAVDNAGTVLLTAGTGRVTAGGNARTRDAAAVSLLHALQRQQEGGRRRKGNG